MYRKVGAITNPTKSRLLPGWLQARSRMLAPVFANVAIGSLLAHDEVVAVRNARWYSVWSRSDAGEKVRRKLRHRRVVDVEDISNGGQAILRERNHRENQIGGGRTRVLRLRFDAYAFSPSVGGRLRLKGRGRDDR